MLACANPPGVLWLHMRAWPADMRLVFGPVGDRGEISGCATGNSYQVTVVQNCVDNR